MRGGPAQGREHLLRAAAQQRRVRRRPDRVEEFPLYGRELDVLARGRRNSHRHRPAPLSQRQDEVPGRRLGPSGGRRPLALAGQLTKAQQVDLLGGRLQQVAAGTAQQTPPRGAGRQPRFEQPPQRSDVAPHHVQRAGGRPLGPQDVEDLARRHGPPRVRQEQGEQGALLGEARIELPFLPPDPDRTQHLEPHRLTPPRSRPAGAVPARRAGPRPVPSVLAAAPRAGTAGTGGAGAGRQPAPAWPFRASSSASTRSASGCSSPLRRTRASFHAVRAPSWSPVARCVSPTRTRMSAST